MFSRPSVPSLVLSLLLLPGALAGTTPSVSSPQPGALGDTVRMMLGPIAHNAIPEGPLDSSALAEAVAAHLRAEPGLVVVERREDALHMVTSNVTQTPNGRALVQVRLIRVADALVVGQRAVDVTLSPEGPPLARLIADELIRLIEEAAGHPRGDPA